MSFVELNPVRVRAWAIALYFIVVVVAAKSAEMPLVPADSNIGKHLDGHQLLLLNPLESSVKMDGNSWKMSRISLTSEEKPDPKFGSTVVKMEARAECSGAKGDVRVYGKLDGEPKYLGMWTYIDKGANVGSVGFQIYDGEGEALMYKTNLEGFEGGWKFIEADFFGDGVLQAWKQKDKNGRLDYPIKGINVFWFAKKEGETKLVVDSLVSLANIQENPELSALAMMPSSIEINQKAVCQFVITNTMPESSKAEVKWVVQRNGDYRTAVLPDNRYGLDIAKGCPSWTLYEGKKIAENTLTDTELNSYASTEYDKAGKIKEAFQIIDLGTPQEIRHIRFTNSDAKWTWLVSLSGSMDGKNWTDFEDMKSIDMYRKWGKQDISIPVAQKFRYFRIRHHKDGEGVQKIAMPVKVEIFDGTDDEKWDFPYIGENMAEGTLEGNVPAHNFILLSCKTAEGFSPGSYLFLARIKLGGKTVMCKQQFFVMPSKLKNEELEPRIGVNTSNIAYLPLNRRLGVKWVRFENLKWRLMSKAPKQVVFDGLAPWGVNHDEYFSTAKSYGINGLGYLFMSPRYTSSCPAELNFKHDAAYPPKNPEDYYFYVNQVVARYGKVKHQKENLVSKDKKSGLDLVQAYEIWNEPNLNSPSWGHWIGTLDEYYDFMRPATVAAHRADPKALVFNGGFAGIELGLINTLATYTYKDGTHPCDFLDGLSVHTYTGAIAPELSKIDTNLHRGSNAVSGTPHLENLMRLSDWRNMNMKGKLLWMTETGYDTGGARAVSMRNHAAYTVRNILMMLGAGIDQVLIYREAGDGNSLYAASGMLTSQGQPRASYFTLATLIRQITGSGPIHKLQLDNPDIWAYAWSKDGKPAMVAWSVSDSGKLKLNLGAATMTDAFGYDSKVKNTQGLQLSSMPLYLSDVDKPDVLLKEIEKSKKWYDSWTKERHKRMKLKTYLFDMGGKEYVDAYDLGMIRPYTPVGFDEIYSDQKKYGFTSGGIKNVDISWINNKASRDGVAFEKESGEFKFKAEPGVYKLELRCYPRGGADATIVVSGLKGGDVSLTVNIKKPDAIIEKVVVTDKPITIKTRNWVTLNYIRLVELEK